MNSYIIRLSSVTYAMRAQKLLEQHGYRCRVRKLAKNLSAKGCGYGLEIYGGDINNAVSIVSAAGIRVLETLEQAS